MVRAREVALESIQLSSGVDASGLARIAANATNPPRGHVDWVLSLALRLRARRKRARRSETESRRYCTSHHSPVQRRSRDGM